MNAFSRHRFPRFPNDMAEGEGFEPPVRFPVQWFSRPPPSTTRPSLRVENLAEIRAIWAPAISHQNTARRAHVFGRIARTPCRPELSAARGVTPSVTAVKRRDPDLTLCHCIAGRAREKLAQIAASHAIAVPSVTWVSTTQSIAKRIRSNSVFRSHDISLSNIRETRDPR